MSPQPESQPELSQRNSTTRADQAPRTRPDVDPSVYAEVLHFHSWQMRLLDDALRDDEALRTWVRTFTEDGEQRLAVFPEPVRGREAIARSVRENPDNLAVVRAGHQRRHLVLNLVVRQSSDGGLASSYYAAYADVTDAAEPVFGRTAVVYEQLVRERGELYTRSRVVAPDAPRP